MSTKKNLSIEDFHCKNLEQKIAFNKKELGKILNIYGRMVAIGEWKDYGISILKNLSVFSIYKHNTEFPIYMVKKNMIRTDKRVIFSVVAMDGQILKKGYDLSSVLKPLELKLIRRIK